MSDKTSWSINSSFKIYSTNGTYQEIPCTRHLMVSNGGLFPAMIQLHSGELIAAVRGGFWHGSAPPGYKEASIDIIRSSDYGESWTKPLTIIDSDDDDRDPTLGQLDDETLVLAYTRRRAYLADENAHPSGDRRDETWFTRSEDEGHTWEECKPVPIPPGFVATGTPGDGQDVIQLDDGTAIFTGGLRKTFDVVPCGDHAIFRSTDSGKTWGDVTSFDLDMGCEEVALLKLPSGKLLAALRGGGVKSDAIWITESDDNGRSWPNPPRKVTDEHQHPADLLILSNGNILMSFGSRHAPYGVRGLISKDEGETWDYSHAIVLVDNCAEWDCGYPTTLALPDGMLITCYYRSLSEDPYFEGLGTKAISATIKYKEKDLIEALGK